MSPLAFAVAGVAVGVTLLFAARSAGRTVTRQQLRQRAVTAAEQRQALDRLRRAVAAADREREEGEADG